MRGGFTTADGSTLTLDHRQWPGTAAGIVAVDIDPRSKKGAVHRAASLEIRVDHLVYATPDLAMTVAQITDEWGIAPTPGGRHDGRGTANELLALGGGAYLEIIGPDPEQPEPSTPRPFGVDGITEPQLVTWAAAVPDLDLWLEWCAARKIDPGPAFDMQRTTPGGDVLRWRLTMPPEDGAGLIPFLIEWPGETPATSSAPGVELFGLSFQYPDQRVAARFREYALPYAVETGPARMAATLLTPNNIVELTGGPRPVPPR